MHPDTVQIGSFVLSKSVFDGLLVMFGVITGGLITYLTTRSNENRRWATQKLDRLQEHRREAFALALEWLPPIELAVEKAAMLASGYLQDEITDNEMSKRWPNILHELAKRDLPMRLNVLLPTSIQQRSDALIDEIIYLQSYALYLKPARKADQAEWTKQFQAFNDRLSEVRTRFSDLKQELKSEYNKTFA